MRDIRLHLIIIFCSFVILVLIAGHKLPPIMLPKAFQHKTIASIPVAKAMDRQDFIDITGMGNKDSNAPMYNCWDSYSQFCKTEKCKQNIRTLCANSYDGILRCDDVSKLLGNPVYTCWGGWQ